MTIFGIGGCMALMVVGFGLKDCIYEIVSLQYEKVQFYDAATYMSDDISEENRQQIHEISGSECRCKRDDRSTYAEDRCKVCIW